MNVGSIRRARAWLVALSVIATACNRPESVTAKVNHGVALLQQEQPPGHWKAIASPETRIIHNYNPGLPNSNHVVIWAYGHKSTTIHFEDPLITKDPACGGGVCMWEVPPGLLKSDEKSKKFKYTVTGELDDNTHLEPNDPWIQVDR